MRQLTCSPTVEVSGQYLIAYISNLQGYETKPVVEKLGLLDTKPNEWYSCQNFLDILNELGKLPNNSQNTLAIGMEIGKMIPVPPGMENATLEQMLMGLDFAYQGAHRNGDIGRFNCEKLAGNHYTMTCTDLYPDDLTYGIIYSLARRFVPPQTAFKVYYDTVITPRDRGGNRSTVIHVCWD
jgi:hypothetical protein